MLVRAAKAAQADGVPTLASAVAYSGFLAIPAVLLVMVGGFSAVASRDLVDSLISRFSTVLPGEAVTLVEDSLLQLESRPSTGILMAIVGFAIALWTSTGAVSTLMSAVNQAYDLEDSRSFLRKRLVAVALVLLLGSAGLLVAVLLVLGSHLQRWIGEALDAESAVAWTWSTARWPILVVVLFVAFSALFALATDRTSRRWRILSPGALVAVCLWFTASYGFSLYAANFGAYNKTWGSLSAAIVTLVWLWLSALALLYGAEVNAEAERTARERSHEDDGEDTPHPRPAG